MCACVSVCTMHMFLFHRIKNANFLLNKKKTCKIDIGFGKRNKKVIRPEYWCRMRMIDSILSNAKRMRAGEEDAIWHHNECKIVYIAFVYICNSACALETIYKNASEKTNKLQWHTFFFLSTVLRFHMYLCTPSIRKYRIIRLDHTVT